MTVSAPQITPRPAWPRELLACGLVAAAVAVLLVAFGPAPGDAEVHLYRTFLVEHRTYLWDNFWYEGDFPLVSYSVLYYLPAAVLGNLPLVVGAVVTSTLLFASIAHHEWGDAAVWPSRAFAVFAAAPLFTGLYSYSLGFAMLLGTLRALQASRIWAAIVLSALTLGFSPLAFAFLVLVLVSVFVARRRVNRSTVALGVGIALLAGLELFVLRLFPTGGSYPFHLVNLAGVLGVCTLGVLLARRAQGGGPLVAFFALWGVTSVAASAFQSPIGGNWTRLNEVVFPLMLLTAFLARFRPRRLVIVALLGALVYDLAPPLLLVPYRLDNRPASVHFWQPAIHYLDRHSQPGYRVEVVPTAAHWESYWIPRAGFALARGWYRQLDVADNPVLYTHHLDARSYEHWLRSVAVEYVLLPSTTLDPVGGPREASVVRSGVPGLERVYADRNWTIYRLSHPTPLVSGPGRARIDVFGHTLIAGFAPTTGPYLLRVHFVPFWETSGNVCVRRAPGDMTLLEVSTPGRFSLRVASTGEAIVRAAVGGGSCG